MAEGEEEKGRKTVGLDRLGVGVIGRISFSFHLLQANMDTYLAGGSTISGGGSLEYKSVVPSGSLPRRSRRDG